MHVVWTVNYILVGFLCWGTLREGLHILFSSSSSFSLDIKLKFGIPVSMVYQWCYLFLTRLSLCRFFFDFSPTYVGCGLICPHIVNCSVLLGAIISWGFLWPFISQHAGAWYPADLSSNDFKGLYGYKVWRITIFILKHIHKFQQNDLTVKGFWLCMAWHLEVLP